MSIRVKTISNHPENSKIKREAVLHELSYLESLKEVRIVIRIEHFENGKKSLVPDGYVTVKATDYVFVNSQGKIVPKKILNEQEEYVDNPEAIMTEYDFFEHLTEQQISFNQIIRSKILWLDSEEGGNRINKYTGKNYKEVS